MGAPPAKTSEALEACPDAGQLSELALGTLEVATRERVRSHVDACEECAEVVRLAAASGGVSSIAGSAGARRLPSPGEVLAEKYRVERVLGIGGMGVVVAATHLQLGRLVALKLMLPDAAASPGATARFIQEARAAAGVQSEHVARVLDVGTLEDGAPFMVMEYLRGSDFARLLRSHGPLSLIDVAGYLLQACEAVAEAHALGIVHRDLKPANLFLTTRADGSPLVKVLDFGISKLTRGTGSGEILTKSQTVMGTPLYMSPEQLRSSRTVGPGTDIWALGCIFYELLVGRPAFHAESAEALGALIAAGPTPRVRDDRPELPATLETVIGRCLEKDPAARFASVGDLAREIGQFAPGDMAPLVGRVARISARPESPLLFADTRGPDRPPRFSGTGASFVRSQSGQRARSRDGRTVLRMLGAVLAVGAVAWVAFAFSGRGRRGEVAAVSPPSAVQSVRAPFVTPPPPTAVAVAIDAGLDAHHAPPRAASTAVPPPQRRGAGAPVSPSAPSAAPSSPTMKDRDRIE